MCIRDSSCLANSNKDKIWSLFKSEEERKLLLLKGVNLEAKLEDGEAINKPQISFIVDKGYKVKWFN